VEKQQEYVLRTVEERDIRFIRLWFTDVLGFLKSVAITAAELENAFSEGIGFDGSSIDGFARVQEADMIAVPDAADVPGPAVATGGQGRRADVLRHPDPGRRAVRGGPAAGAPPQPDPAAELGFTFYVHPEMEFFLFASPNDPTPLDNGTYFDMTPSTSSRTSGARRSTCSRRWASRWSTPTTRSPRPSTRSTCATPTR
jgi:glutamine synthetase